MSPASKRKRERRREKRDKEEEKNRTEGKWGGRSGKAFQLKKPRERKAQRHETASVLGAGKAN